MASARSHNDKNTSSANIGFGSEALARRRQLRGNMDAAEYKHVVLGLIFLKYISDSFEDTMRSSSQAKMNTLASARSSMTRWSRSSATTRD